MAMLGPQQTTRLAPAIPTTTAGTEPSRPSAPTLALIRATRPTLASMPTSVWMILAIRLTMLIITPHLPRGRLTTEATRAPLPLATPILCRADRTATVLGRRLARLRMLHANRFHPRRHLLHTILMPAARRIRPTCDVLSHRRPLHPMHARCCLHFRRAPQRRGTPQHRQGDLADTRRPWKLRIRRG